MNRSIRLTLLSIFALGFTGCEQFHGTLTVHSNFSMKNHHIANRVANFLPGSYSTKVELHHVRNLLELKVEGHPTIKFRIPDELTHHDGPLELRGEEIGELWNAQGSFSTDTYDTPTRPGTMSCVLYYRTVVTGWTRRGGPIYSSTPVYGTQNVLKHDKVTTRKIDIHFVSRDDSTHLADLSGDDPTIVTLIDSVTSPCY